ncbi:MAG: hypothetical protein RLZZ245_2612, partial [Verrucomicrobiota bacterium]
GADGWVFDAGVFRDGDAGWKLGRRVAAPLRREKGVKLRCVMGGHTW